MPQNVWSAGRDEMLKTLAARDAQARLEEEAQRRAAEDASMDRYRQAQIENSKEQIGISRTNAETARRSADALEGQRTAQTAEIERATKEKSEKDAKVERLVKVVTDPKLPQNIRDEAGLMLDAMGVAPNALKAFLTQPKTTKPVMRIGRDGKMTQIGEAEQGAHFSNEPAPHVGSQAGAKQDPTLPAGVTAWIDSIGQNVGSVEEARKQLSQGWRHQVAAHPRAQLSDAAKYLDTLYPKDSTGARENVFGANDTQAEFAKAEKLTGQDVTKVITVVDPASGKEKTGPYGELKDYIAAGAKVK